MWSEGFRRVILPGFLCESMIAPFQRRDWVIGFSDVNDRLRPDWKSYEEQTLDDPHTTVVLIADYFGRNLDDDARRAVVRWQDRGSVVVEDRTHNLLDDASSDATFTFGSLRKLLPVGDGCFVRGLATPPHLAPQALDPSELSWAAMDLKAEGSVDDDTAYERYRAAEAAFEVASEPAPMSSRSVEQLEHLDFSAMRRARTSNFGVLREQLTGMSVVNDDCADGTPAYLVLRSRQPKALQTLLADRGIYCPIHWPRPPQVPDDIAWNEDLISVPIDHRYGHREMVYVGRTVSEVASRLG
jgi:hypothetical protein